MVRWLWRGLLALSGTLMGIMVAPVLVSAATILVTGDGSAIDPRDGACSLAEALIAANSDAPATRWPGECEGGQGADRIILQVGKTYTLTRPYEGTSSGLPAIESSITIEGQGSTIERSTTPGTPPFNFLVVVGGIQAEGALTITNLTLRNGLAPGSGGAITSSGFLSVVDSTISGNSASGSGGGIAAYPAFRAPSYLFVVRSTLTGNRANGSGGGIHYGSGASPGLPPMSIFSSTISGNSALVDGGGVNNDGAVMEIYNTTITDNSAGAKGGGFNRFANTIRFSIIAGNRAAGSALVATADCLINRNNFSVGGTIASNLTGLGTGCLGDDPNEPHVDPARGLAGVLGPLANNGGPTATHELPDGSPAINALAASACSEVDQRGIPRPQGRGCDIGAVERESAEGLPPTTTAGGLSWYFAEGYTGAGFDEYLTILNPNPQEARLQVTYYLPAVRPIVRWIAAPPNARLTVAVHEAIDGVGRGQAVSVRVQSTNSVGVIVERPIYFTYGAGITGGHTVMGAPAPRSTWYFAEGFTGDGFDEYLTILNTTGSDAPVTITYYLATGAPLVKTLTAPATSRTTVAVHEPRLGVGRGQAVSARVQSTSGVGIVVERPTYFTYGAGITGGHTTIGAEAPRQAWYFAEGYTGVGFDQYLTILNPNATPASVTVTYYLRGGAPRVTVLTVAPRQRATVVVHETAQGVGRNQEVAATITTTHPEGIVAERPIYFVYGSGITGGHVVLGAPAPRATWYFAEGYTGAGFDEYLTILNPGPVDVAVTLTYYSTSGAPEVKSVTAAANARTTVAVHDEKLGVGRGKAVAAKVTASNGARIVVERPIYFVYGAGVDGGHDVMGYAP